MRYHQTPTKMAKIKKTEILHIGQDVKQPELSYSDGGLQNGTNTLEKGWQFQLHKRYAHNCS